MRRGMAALGLRQLHVFFWDLLETNMHLQMLQVLAACFLSNHVSIPMTQQSLVGSSTFAIGATNYFAWREESCFAAFGFLTPPC